MSTKEKQDSPTYLDSNSIEYPKDEKEVSNLSKDQSELKNELETHRMSYENLVDKATLEIENFIKKHDTNKNAQ